MLSSPARVKILNAKVEFSRQPLRKPLQLSSGLIISATLATASVTVQVAGRVAEGKGSIYLSDLWAWPEPKLAPAERDAALRDYTCGIANNLWTMWGGEEVSPLELGLRLHHTLSHEDAAHQNESGRFIIPVLARAMCASPFDAAIHDAVGQALESSAFDLYSDPLPTPSADHYFKEGNAAGAIARIIEEPRPAADAWLLVGAKDDLAKDVRPWIRERGYRCFKLKLLAQDNAADVARTVEVFHAVKLAGAATPRLSVDSNEANPDAASVLDYLERLRAADSEAFAALEYLEQPTGRDIVKSAFDWREVDKLKPVFLDEGLTSLELLQTARDQHWSGLAIKTCKGHSFALVAAAWARENGMQLTLQDLTNPGFAGIHAALFAGRIPMLNGIELNSPQYTPDANTEWLPRLPGLFDVQGGVHQLPTGHVHGLGSRL